MVQLRSAALFVVCVGGIYASYLTQGLMSEKLSTTQYGPRQERFIHLEVLNGAQALVCCVWGAVLLHATRAFAGNGRKQRQQQAGLKQPQQQLQNGRHQQQEQRQQQQQVNLGPGGDAPWTVYWKPALTNAVGPACGMFALNNISYTAQVLAKSCKMVPVMLVGAALHSKQYSGLEYVCMSLVGLGVGLFARRGSPKVAAKLTSPNPTLGYTLCALNLLLDGYTNAAQDDINSRYPHSSPLHMMCWMNFWTACPYILYLAWQRAATIELVQFCSRNRTAANDIALFCLCGAVGQIFIFLMIKRFGSLANTLVCTTRKFFNILLSVLLNANPLLATQWLAVVMVFTGLLTNAVNKSKKHKKA